MCPSKSSEGCGLGTAPLDLILGTPKSSCRETLRQPHCSAEIVLPGQMLKSDLAIVLALFRIPKHDSQCILDDWLLVLFLVPLLQPHSHELHATADL